MKNINSFQAFIFLAIFMFPTLLAAQQTKQQEECKIQIAFDYAVEDLEVKFTNLSEGYDNVSWNFGDGKKSTEVSPTHQYEKTNAYKFCLTLTKNTTEECSEEFCGQVYVFDPCE